MLNLIRERGDIDKINLYTKDLSEPKYELLIKKLEDAGKKLMIQMHLLSVQIQWTMSMKILMITT